MTELEYSIAERFDEGRWSRDGKAGNMGQRARQLPEPSVSEVRA